jgi:hypothetical protein
MSRYNAAMKELCWLSPLKGIKKKSKKAKKCYKEGK